MKFGMRMWEQSHLTSKHRKIPLEAHFEGAVPKGFYILLLKFYNPAEWIFLAPVLDVGEMVI